MGLIRAFKGALSSTLSDQWLEYFYCDALPQNVAVRKGSKLTLGGNKLASNVISDGSLIAVNEGQAMIIVDDGKIVDFCAEAGGYKFDTSSEPSIFSGDLWESVKNSFEELKRRFTFGGDTGKDQRIYYFNLKEMPCFKFGTPESLLYDDPVYKSIRIRFFGTATLKISDPIKFYTNVCGNVQGDYMINDYWDRQLRDEFVTYLGQAMSSLAASGTKYIQIPQSQLELVKYMNNAVDDEWTKERGLIIAQTAIPSVSLDPDDQERINKFDEMAVMSDPANAAGRLAASQANALENAAKNEGGAVNAFMGVGLAGQAAGSNLKDMFYLAKSENKQNDWQCSCGRKATGKFCSECGKALKKICSCGTEVTSKFCPECGSKM